MFLKLEKIIFYLLVFCLPLQVRHIFYNFGGGQFNEWQGIYLYATDILILALLILWVLRIFCHSRLRSAGGSGEASESGNLVESGSRVRPGMTNRMCGMTEKMLFLFLLFSVLSLFFAKNFWLGFYSFAKLTEFVLLFLYLKRNFSRLFDAQKFWLVFVSSALVQALVAIIQFFYQKGLGLKFLAESPLSPDLAGVAKIVVDNEKIIRAYGLTPHPNILAAILVVAIFGIGYLFLKNYKFCHSYFSVIPAKAGIQVNLNSGSRIPPSLKLWRTGKCGMTKWLSGMTKQGCFYVKIIFIAIFFLFIFTLFLTFSRVILVLGFLFFLLWLISLWRRSESKKPVKILILFFAIGYMLLAIGYLPLVFARFSDLQPGAQAVDLRLFYLQTAGDFLKQNPVLGIGQGNFVSDLSQKFSELPAWQFQPVHNIYILIASETGLLGLLAFLLFLFLTIKSAWPKRNELFVSCFLAICYWLLAIGFFDHFLWDLQQGQILFWMILGILANLGVHSSTDRAQASGA